MAEISALPEAQQLDALLQFFTTVLAGLPLDKLRERRAELIERFSHCGGRFETCSILLELVDLYVMTRERQATRLAFATRRAANRAAPRVRRDQSRLSAPFKPRPDGDRPGLR